MKTIYLVRHAETTWNLEGKVQGSRDTPLSIDGLAQTVKTVAFLSALQFDTIFTSPLTRARAIAEPVGVNLGISPIVMPELREIEFGGWEGHTWNEIGAMYPTTLAAWELKSLEARPDGGESLADVGHRAEKVRSMVESNSGELLLVVAHGGFNRVLMSVLLDLPLSSYNSFTQPNACISVFETKTSKWQARVIDSTCHLA
ncbi:histidine phosphatase family protein [Candidatus Cryosericum hinesii]|jgi:broad specificity phosphatase PhoE|uniref:Histidine phosphatase family protein n=1 Tax=Candidatus Cryosericum hinesii TaxID=2290915 RepID=A0A398DU46_9BACT|nr:histidine phosphatase family protein [Candidatus Cryosericum hinesii]RIE10907.1 histidine phosphatase family protein [Candidatus Cryosericum hinesii]RIE14031.1 histidine phosphatase family protein [Candidatus Cryosericum hinesii]RIE15046.1 histidine phosphatase family protein [Candidatus Cryosericum hinesii]